MGVGVGVGVGLGVTTGVLVGAAVGVAVGSCDASTKTTGVGDCVTSSVAFRNCGSPICSKMA